MKIIIIIIYLYSAKSIVYSKALFKLIILICSPTGPSRRLIKCVTA